jgi:hypothetical protein
MTTRTGALGCGEYSPQRLFEGDSLQTCLLHQHSQPFNYGYKRCVLNLFLSCRVSKAARPIRSRCKPLCNVRQQRIDGKTCTHHRSLRRVSAAPASIRPRSADEVYAALVVPVHAISTQMASILRLPIPRTKPPSIT